MGSLARYDWKLDLSIYLRVWGCRGYHTVTNGHAKLDNKPWSGLYRLRYDGDTAAYRLFNPATRKTMTIS